MVEGTFSFTGGALATLSRGRSVYAAGASISLGRGVSELVLSDLRPLTDGRYELTVRKRRGHRFSVSLMQVVVRQ